MAIYTVHLPPDAITPEQVAEKAVFVKEGFAFPGFIFTGLWLLYNRIWLKAILFIAAFVAVLASFWYFNLPRLALGPVQLLMALLVGTEGHEWLRRKYAALGWTHAGTVSGPSLPECELRFFERWSAEHGAATAAPRPVATPPEQPGAPAATQPGSVLGVFPTARGGA
jgi:Protein of unknown function (DUF2628)